MVLEYGEQRHMQRPSHHGFKALLQSGPLQQADDRRPAHLSACHNHREQDSSSYWHLYWTPATGIQQNTGMRRNIFNCIKNPPFFVFFFVCLFAACVDKIKSYNLCQLLFGWEPEDLIHCCCELIRVSTFRSWRQGTVAITCLWKKEYEYFWANVLKCFRG